MSKYTIRALLLLNVVLMYTALFIGVITSDLYLAVACPALGATAFIFIALLDHVVSIRKGCA